MGIWGWFKSKILKRDEDNAEKVLKYWQTSKEEACGNCMHFSFSVFDEPGCQLPNYLIPDGYPKKKIKSGEEVVPGGHCICWARRGENADN